MELSVHCAGRAPGSPHVLPASLERPSSLSDEGEPGGALRPRRRLWEAALTGGRAGAEAGLRAGPTRTRLVFSARPLV